MVVSLDDMALFVEVVKAKGFTRAADITGVPSSTLSRRVGGLEKKIGLRLLHRTTRKIELTEAGLLYFERCRRIVEEANLAHEQLGNMITQPSGVLRASLPVDFSIVFLAPLLPEFIHRYPDITFDFDFTPRNVDMIGESIDVAIRMGQQPDTNLIAQQLATLIPRLYASPRYLEIYGEPQLPEDLHHHQCINILKSGIWQLKRNQVTENVSISSKFNINSVGMIKQLATLDMGIILMPEEVVRDQLNCGGLQRILPEWQGVPAPIYAITETRLLPAKTRCFIQFLREHLGSA